MQRLVAIDRLRGLVMVLMTSDHAAHVFYRDHLIRDSVGIPAWQEPLPTLPFLHRWLSHLCAPTFVFLAGTSIALAAARRSGRPGSGSFDRDLLWRGLLLIALDLVLISPLWGPAFGCRFVLQVLWALGGGMLLMMLLRRCSLRVQLALALLLLSCSEAAIGIALGALSGGPLHDPDALTAIVLSGGLRQPHLAVAYPLLPWLGAMLLGHVYGGFLLQERDPVRPLLVGGGLALATWFVVRCVDGYGNLGMTGLHDSWLRWLQVSKYPPSLAFFGLELGLMAWLLAALFAWQRNRPPAIATGAPLLVFGQTALFFYVLHIPALEGAGAMLRWWLGADRLPGGLLQTWMAVTATAALLYPACRWFRTQKRRWPGSLLRLL